MGSQKEQEGNKRGRKRATTGLLIIIIFGTGGK